MAAMHAEAASSQPTHARKRHSSSITIAMASSVVVRKGEASERARQLSNPYSYYQVLYLDRIYVIALVRRVLLHKHWYS